MPLLPVENSVESPLLPETRFQVVRQVGVLKQAIHDGTGVRVNPDSMDCRVSNEETGCYASLTGAERSVRDVLGWDDCVLSDLDRIFTDDFTQRVLNTLGDPSTDTTAKSFRIELIIVWNSTPCQIASEKALFARVAEEKPVVKLPPAAKKGRRYKSAKQLDIVEMPDRADRSGHVCVPPMAFGDFEYRISRVSNIDADYVQYYDRPLFVEERDDHFARTRCSWLPKRDEGPFRGPDDAPYRDTMGFVGPVYVNPPSFWMAMFIQPDELNDEDACTGLLGENDKEIAG